METADRCTASGSAHNSTGLTRRSSEQTWTSQANEATLQAHPGSRNQHSCRRALGRCADLGRPLDASSRNPGHHDLAAQLALEALSDPTAGHFVGAKAQLETFRIIHG